MDETWVKLYCCDEVEVSTLGNIRRTDRILADGRMFKGANVPICYKQKYGRFSYTYKGKRHFMSVHRAVFFSFNDIEIPKDKHRIIVDHIDNNKHNNRLDNLQLITQSENVIKSLNMDYNSDFKYDLKLGQLGEGWIGKMLSDETIEVKFDFACYRTGNFYIEYESRGKPSGIATTKARYWMLIASTEKGCELKNSLRQLEDDDILFSILMPTENLKNLCRTKYFRKNVSGGDSNTSTGILIKSNQLLCQHKTKSEE